MRGIVEVNTLRGEAGGRSASVLAAALGQERCDSTETDVHRCRKTRSTDAAVFMRRCMCQTPFYLLQTNRDKKLVGKLDTPAASQPNIDLHTRTMDFFHFSA